MLISDKLRQAGSEPNPGSVIKSPVWEGPCDEGPNGGITYSLLNRFLGCRERFRLRVIEGLRPADVFSHRIEYGQMWHTCEEASASEKKHFQGELNGIDTTLWADRLESYCEGLVRKYPLMREQIAHWFNVCRTQFPIYVQYWAKHPDVIDRTPLAQEQVFDVPYSLPSGRTVRLRGKWDSVDLIGTGKGASIFLQENKTKGKIVENQLKRQLTFDLQTMIYSISLRNHYDKMGWASKGSIAGVRYNVVRRPLDGGKDCIRQYKPTKKNPRGESPAEFYRRLGGLIAQDPKHYFMRWVVTITPADLIRFRRECFDPILEQLCDWWQFIRPDKNIKGPFSGSWGIHWRHPYGTYNPLDEGGSSELDEYLATGSTLGLVRVNNLFPELTEEKDGSG